MATTPVPSLPAGLSEEALQQTLALIAQKRAADGLPPLEMPSSLPAAAPAAVQPVASQAEAALAAAARRREEYYYAGAGAGWERRLPAVRAGPVAPPAARRPLITFDQPLPSGSVYRGWVQSGLAAEAAPREPAAAPQAASEGTSYPPTLRFWPVLGLSAIRAGQGGAWRYWALAQALDEPGSGVVQEADLRACLTALEVEPRTQRRWAAQARSLGLVRQTRRPGRLLLAGQRRAAELLGCEYIGPRPVRISAARLVQEGWRGYVWAGYLAACHQDHMISRATLDVITGVPGQTQREWERADGGLVYNTPNIVLTDLPPDHLDGFREQVRPSAFVLEERATRRSVLAYRLPDRRYVPPFTARSLGRGRSGKVNRCLKYRSTDGNGNLLSPAEKPVAEQANAGSDAALCESGRGHRRDPEASGRLRLFHTEKKRLRSVLRRLSRSDRSDVREIFERLPDLPRRRGRYYLGPLNRTGRWREVQVR